jgi:ribonuclease D
LIARSIPEVDQEMVVSAQQLEECCAQMEASPHIGFDTEFVGEHTYHPTLCLIQIATSKRLFLIDPLTVGPLGAFWKIIADPKHEIVVHAGRQDVHLCRMAAGAPPGRLFDLQIAAGLVGTIYPIGHGTLVAKELGIQIAKGETLTEWGIRPLTPKQIRYAFEDVKYLLVLREILATRLEERGRTGWAEEEFQLLRLDIRAEEAVREKWNKLRGLGGLDRRTLAVVRALYNWREDAAAAHNRPARTFLRDDLIIEIARRRPGEDRDLMSIRGVGKKFVPAILRAVEAAHQLPIEQCPPFVEREQEPPQVSLIGNILAAVLGNLCYRAQLAVGFVANQEDLRSLVRARLMGKPLSDRSALSRGWRRDHILPELEEVLQGHRTLRITDIQSEAPLAIVDETQPQ